MESVFRDRRKNYFIDKRFQTLFILKFCVLVILALIISGTIIYTISKSTVTTTFEDCRLKIKSTADFILPAILLSSPLVIIIISLVTIGVTLFTSHRIAGPLYRIQQDIEEVASGNLKKGFYLRKSDELKPLAESFNNLVQVLRENLTEIKNKVSALEAELAKGGKVSAQSRRNLEELKAVLERFKT